MKSCCSFQAPAWNDIAMEAPASIFFINFSLRFMALLVTKVLGEQLYINLDLHSSAMYIFYT